MFLLLKDLLIPSHLHPYLIMAKICWTWHKFIVCAPITGLKLSSLACKTGFYKPKHKRKGDFMELNFEGLELQKRNVVTEIIQIVDEKMGSFVWLPCLLKKISQLHLNVLPKLWLIVCCRLQKEEKEPCLHFNNHKFESKLVFYHF